MCLLLFKKFYRKKEIIKFDIKHQRYRNNFGLILIKSDGRKIKIVSVLNKTVNLDETKNLIKFLNKYRWTNEKRYRTWYKYKIMSIIVYRIPIFK